MTDEASKVQELSIQYRALEAICSLWVAASEAKDQRIEELEAECNQLRKRVARLSRQMGRRQNTATSRAVRFAR